MSTKEMFTKQNIWKSNSEGEFGEEQNQNQNQIETQKELNILGLKFDLDNIRSKGYQNPKFVIYLFFVLNAIENILILLYYGYATNWNLLAFCPIYFGAIIGSIAFLTEFNQLHEQQNLKSLIYAKLVELVASGLYNFSIIYGIIKKIPFKSSMLEMVADFPILFLVCLSCCLYGNYTNSPKQQQQQQYLSQYNNNINTNINSNKNLFQVRNASIQNLRKSLQKKDFSGKKYEIGKWKIYRQRLWVGFVLSIMYMDVLSDMYYGYVLFSAYGAFSTLLKVFGISLMVCCIGDLFLVVYMLIFPGRVNYLAHVVAFVMEIPNFVFTGLSIWRIRYYTFKKQIDFQDVLQLAILSVVTTSVNALIHIMYIVDSWAVQNAIEFMQDQQQ